MESSGKETIALHTLRRASHIRRLLNSQGIACSLETYIDTENIDTALVRVNVNTSDVVQAVRIVETDELLEFDNNESAVNPIVIIPVDFSAVTDKACEVGFSIANAAGAKVVLLHAFSMPINVGSMIGLDPTGLVQPAVADTEMEIEEDETIESVVTKRMDALVDALRSKIEVGSLPDISFESRIENGIPEDVINETAHSLSPIMIVMGTDNEDASHRMMLGSVTAEVVDSCRNTILTFPGDALPAGLESVNSVVMLANLEPTDIIIADEIYRLLGARDLTVRIVNIPRRHQGEDVATSLQALAGMCSDRYPSYKFECEEISRKDKRSATEGEISADLIVVPNRKQNAFARLFNPGVAHRLIFSTRTALLAVPI